jgi:hypothetical protein
MFKKLKKKKKRIYNPPPPPRVLVVATISSIDIICGTIESEQHRNFCSLVTTLSLLQSNMMAHCESPELSSGTRFS